MPTSGRNMKQIIAFLFHLIGFPSNYVECIAVTTRHPNGEAASMVKIKKGVEGDENESH